MNKTVVGHYCLVKRVCVSSPSDLAEANTLTFAPSCLYQPYVLLCMAGSHAADPRRGHCRKKNTEHKHLLQSKASPFYFFLWLRRSLFKFSFTHPKQLSHPRVRVTYYYYYTVQGWHFERICGSFIRQAQRGTKIDKQWDGKRKKNRDEHFQSSEIRFIRHRFYLLSLLCLFLCV